LLQVQSWVWWLVVIPYALATGRFVPTPAMAWGFAGGASGFAGLYLFIRGLEDGPISIHAPIFRLNFVVTVFLVIVLLDERLTPYTSVGLVLALAATWLLMGSGAHDERVAGNGRRRSAIQLAIGTIAFGACNFFQTVGLRHGASPETIAVATGTAFALAATIVVYWSTGQLRPSGATLKYGMTGVLLVGAVVCLLHGIALGQASVLVPITQMAFVISAVLGIVAFHEHLTIRKVVGLCLALAALAVLMKA
jgi:uncharacterized membrane protein